MYQLFRVDTDIWVNLQYTLKMFLKYFFVFLTKLIYKYWSLPHKAGATEDMDGYI